MQVFVGDFLFSDKIDTFILLEYSVDQGGTDHAKL